MYGKVVLGLLICSVIIMTSVEINTQENKKTLEEIQFRSPFRYVIADTRIDYPTKKKKNGTRFVEVLMDKKAFSEDNLVSLFHLVSNRFPKPEEMFVIVYTDLEDIETPDERDMDKMSEDNRVSNAPNQQDTAHFTRSKDVNNIVISYADGTADEIEIKGKP